MNLIDINTEGIGTAGWHRNLESFASSVLEILSIDNWEVSILLCDDSRIQKLNRSYRGKDEPTDVLSFALYADGNQNDYSAIESCATISAGDIIISMETLKRQAAEFNVSEEEELKRLVIHGILHLKGMDHKTNEVGKEDMLTKQEHILRQLAGEALF